MSRTDKTRPVWVQVMDPHNRGWLEVHHSHDRGVFRRPLDNCNYGDHNPRDLWARVGCSNWSSARAQHSGLYGYHDSAEKMYRRKWTRRQRTTWRLTARELLKATREDVESIDVVSRQHRHSAIWDAW